VERAAYVSRVEQKAKQAASKKEASTRIKLILLFDPEDGSDMFLRNFGFSPNCMACQHREQYWLRSNTPVLRYKRPICYDDVGNVPCLCGISYETHNRAVSQLSRRQTFLGVKQHFILDMQCEEWNPLLYLILAASGDIRTRP
jgi:hypothetical protein